MLGVTWRNIARESLVRGELNERLQLSTVLLTMYDDRTTLTRQSAVANRIPSAAGITAQAGQPVRAE